MEGAPAGADAASAASAARSSPPLSASAGAWTFKSATMPASPLASEAWPSRSMVMVVLPPLSKEPAPDSGKRFSLKESVGPPPPTRSSASRLSSFVDFAALLLRKMSRSAEVLSTLAIGGGTAEVGTDTARGGGGGGGDDDRTLGDSPLSWVAYLFSPSRHDASSSAGLCAGSVFAGYGKLSHALTAPEASK